MSDLVIRPANHNDADTLFMLIESLAGYEKLDPPDAAARERLAKDLWGPKPRAEAWLGLVDGQPVAYAFTFETYSTFLARPTLYLEDLFILPQHRRHGIGRAFFRRLAQEAVSRECGRMEWSCLDWNEPALQFYNKLGAHRQGEWIGFRLTAGQMQALSVER